MTTGVQFTGTLTSKQTSKYFTFGWNAANHIVWYVVPTSVTAVGAEIDWTVSVQRTSATQCTYWITATNLTTATVTFEGRYAILG